MDFALVILAVTFAVQLIVNKTRSDSYRSGFFGLGIFIFAIILIFGWAGYLSWRQYELWKNDAVGKFLLPPYQNLDYFVFYARTRFLYSYFLSLIAGIVFLIAAKFFNKKYQERFFEPVEPYLLATAVFLVGQPGWIFYLIILLALFLIFYIFITLRFFSINRRSDVQKLDRNIGTSDLLPRISLYYLWLPAAILTILISKWISELPWWQTLKF